MALVNRSKDQEVAALIVANPGTLATVMHAIAVRFFGDEIYSWEPETLEMEFKETLDVTPDPDNMNKLHAVIAAITSDSFYRDWVAYVSICSVLVGENSPDELAEITSYELAWGVLEVSLNEDDDGSKFSSDIASLTGVVLDQEGFTSAPSQLSFAKLPERYKGSDYGPDLKKKENESSYHFGVLHEFLQDQALTLFKQIRMLPWMSDQDLHMLVDTISNEIRSVANKKSGDPVFGN